MTVHWLERLIAKNGLRETVPGTSETATNRKDGYHNPNQWLLEQHQAIREAYYKAFEGLQSLANALEAAAEPSGESSDFLIAEHLMACSAIKTMNKSVLGRIL